MPAADLEQLIAFEVSEAISELAEAGVAGGAAYDGLIAAIARANGATLMTLDQRARPTYERLGASVEYLG